MMQKRIKLFWATILVLSSSFTALSKETVCKLNDQVCGNQCYDPEQFECEDLIVCDKKFEFRAICGKTCYDVYDIKLECVTNEQNFSRLCSRGQKICGKECYFADSNDCIDEQFICPVGMEVCLQPKRGGSLYRCFNPHSEKCLRKSLPCPEHLHDWIQRDLENDHCYYEHVCPDNSTLCGRKCHSIYDFGHYCSADDRELCFFNQKYCGFCYFPGSGYTCFKEQVICPPKFQACNLTCYDPNIHICFNDTVICDIGQKSCGSRCYWPGNDTCHGAVHPYEQHPCPNDEVPCGDGCYHPKRSNCLSVKNETKFICPISYEICGQRCKPLLSSSEDCVKENVLCIVDYQICGTTCYNPKSFFKCFDNKTLCGIGEAACGTACYSLKTEQCLELPDDGFTDKWYRELEESAEYHPPAEYGFRR